MKNREIKSFDMEFKASDEGIIEGYAAFFDNVDSYNDVILKGAFTNTIADDMPNMKVFWNHDWKGVPLGRPSQLQETNEGLFFSAKLNNTTTSLDVKEAIKAGDVNKMSIGYSVIDSEVKKVDGQLIRYIKEIKLYEVSPVNFPANDMADITGYKNEDGEIEMNKITEMLSNIKANQSKELCTEFKEANFATDSFQSQMKEMVKVKEDITEGYLYVGSIYGNEFIYNHYGWLNEWTEDEEYFDNYYKQSYSNNNGTIELTGERAQVTPTTAYVDKKSEFKKTKNNVENESKNTDASQIMAKLNEIK